MNLFSVEPSLIEVITSLIENPKLTKIIIANSESEAQEFEEFIKSSSEDYLHPKDILYIPGFFQAGVFRFESARKIIAKRVEASHLLSTHIPRIIICSVAGFSRNFPSIEFTQKNKYEIRVGDDLDPDLLIEQLAQLAYLQVQRVEEVGEFCIRGSIVDLWTPGEKTPSRIEIFGDAVDKIRSFRPSNQRSFQTLDKVTILPSREFVWPYKSQLESAVEKFNSAILHQKVMGVSRSNLLEDLKANVPFAGIDDIFYMFTNEHFISFHEYIAELTFKKNITLSIGYIGHPDSYLKSFHEIEKLYKNSFIAADGKNYPVGKIDSVFPNITKAKQYLIEDHLITSRYSFSQKISEILKPIEKLKLSSRIEKLNQLISQNEIKNILLLANKNDSFLEFIGISSKYFNINIDESNNQINIPKFKIKDLLLPNLTANKVTDKIFCCLLNSKEGFYLPNSSTLAISESWIRGIVSAEKFESFSEIDSKQSSKENSEAFLTAQYSDFIEGDLVVHIQHGIARFRGLMTIKILDITGDFLALEYAENDKIYVPVHKLNLIQIFL